MSRLYDTIGVGYADRRRPDPVIGAPIRRALGPARTVLNVGAGAGSYEPADRSVTAVEPSMAMIRQRPVTAAPAVQARAEGLPFADDHFDALDEAQMPRMEDYGKWLGPVEVSVVQIPHDCADGFLCAYWRRPAAYLDAGVRAAMSSFRALGDVSPGLKRLESDLGSGVWHRRYGDLQEQDTCDCGYRLVCAAVGVNGKQADHTPL